MVETKLIPRFSGQPMKQVIEGGQLSHIEFTSGPCCSFNDALNKTEPKYSFAEGNVFSKDVFQKILDAGDIKYTIDASSDEVICFSDVKFRSGVVEPSATFDDGIKFGKQLSPTIERLKVSDSATLVIVLNPFDAENQELLRGMVVAYKLKNPLLILYWHLSGEN